MVWLAAVIRVICCDNKLQFPEDMLGLLLRFVPNYITSSEESLEVCGWKGIMS